MVSKLLFGIFIVIFIELASTRHVGRYSELDEGDHELLRAAYDTPYYQDSYEEDDDMQLGKVDLLKDGLWALKAKVKELKAFNKALVANMISSKLKIKDMLENHLEEIKKHKHPEKKPSYSYSYQAPAYHTPQYAPPAPLYGASSAHQYTPTHYSSAPQRPSPSAEYGPAVIHLGPGSATSQYGGVSSQYGGVSAQGGVVNSQGGVVNSQYGGVSGQDGVISSQYGGVSSGNKGGASQQYGAQYGISGAQFAPVPQNLESSQGNHDPYYGH